ncbi:anti-sigma factor antagonist [Mycolicibacterium sp. GF69]|uniref:STAS domain-containing protein n=1 Tax=Mycolicibacterium sp. GF69 TaxID=2267251 RepID=UPI000DCC9452|nr:STAS domain-containing protein [Mycolicibacterium sp. GF69]RAV07666.1 anti-sigma factor antagonist [Mycolicibacterium sp. GF69]
MSNPLSSSIGETPPVEHRDCHTAHFATHWVQSDTAIITAQGEIDAANAQAFVEYALRDAAQLNHLVVDLSGVDFFGTSGFSALHTLNVRAAGENIDWDMLPSPSVSRLLRICDPDATLPVRASTETRSSAASANRSLLQLVPESR